MKKALALKGFAVATLWAFLAVHVAPAQQAVTVSGHVTANGQPVLGARLRIDALDLTRTTDGTGYYSLLIPSNRVAGQTVVLTVTYAERRSEFAPQSADLVLTGGPIVRDFDLRSTTTRTDEPKRPGATVPATTPAPTIAVPTRLVADSIGAGLATAVDVISDMAGRFPNLSVTTSSSLGGSASLSYRGIRSLLASAQPLFVVDGVVLDNTNFTTSAQRYGGAGFDYGSPIADINPHDIETLRWVTGPEATTRYGSRAANGVVVITTHNGIGGPRFAVGADYQSTPGDAIRLPALQNSYGQGLGGKFQFFDGQGGGINDAVDQNWGPPLDGRPLAQASYTQPRRGDVEFFNPQPDNVKNFFRDPSVQQVNATVQGRSDASSFWLGIGQATGDGLVPEARLRRRDARASASVHPGSSLSVSANIAIAETRNDNTAGSGFNQGNPVSQFTRFPRQVSTDSLRAHLRAANGDQISWNYAGQNNPYFAELINDNSRERNHLAGGASATYTFYPTLSATASLGSDYYRDDRNFSIGQGWMGGYPFFAGAGDFSKGGFETDNVAAQRTNGALRLDGNRQTGTTHWTYSAGADFSTIHQRVRSAGVDSAADVPAAGAPATAVVPTPVAWTGVGKTTGLFGDVGASYPFGGTAGLSLRHDWTQLVAGQTSGVTYPAVRGALDLVRASPAFEFGGWVQALTIRADWSRASSDATPYAISTLYAGLPLDGSIAPAGNALVGVDSGVKPEVSNRWEIGADITGVDRHVDVGVTYYFDNTSGVIMPLVPAGSSTAVVTNAGNVRNHGIEGSLTFRGGDPRRLTWRFGANAALNYDRVEDLRDGSTSVLLGPAQAGVTAEAIKGLPFGELVGYRMLRDPASGAVLLRNGLPLADTAAGRVVLGQSRQNELLGLNGSIGYRWLTVSLAGDAHIGGSFFSMTSYQGSVAGTLASTAFRPDSGLLIRGTDVTTGQANTTHVTTEAYYHALGSIQEPWIYNATYAKLRELNVSIAVPTGALSYLPFESARVSFVARNLYTWSHDRDVDPEAVLSLSPYPGIELGQLPRVRSVGVQVSIVP